MVLHGQLEHTVTAAVAVEATVAFEYLSDPHSLGSWTLGSFRVTESVEQGVFRGESLFDGSETHFRIEADRTRFCIDYLLGTPDRLVPRIAVRIIPHEVVDRPTETCLVTMTAWRSGLMNDERWGRLCAAHEAEILLIKGQLESDYRD